MIGEMMRIRHIKIFAVILMMAMVCSCNNNPKKPGWAYFPDMVYSRAYETYSANPIFADGQSARPPVPGTIARGTLPDSPKVDKDSFEQSYLFKRYFPETPEGYEAAGAQLKSPVPFSDQAVVEGQKVFEIYCMVCHGEKGDGQGSIVQTGAFPPVNPYSTLLKDKPEGKMFHSITYGKNLMGSYASQVSVEDRWKAIFYIQKLSATGRFAAPTQAQAADTTKSKKK